MDDILVSAEWLVHHLDDKDIRIFDMRSPLEYASGHLPNAVLITYEKIIDFDPNRPYLDVASKERIEELLSEKAVSNDKTIVIYGDRGGASAAKLFWILEMYGATVRILNMSYSAWRSKGYPVTTVTFKPEPTKFSAASQGKDFRVSSDYVASKMGNSNIVLIDTRSPEEYEGYVASGPRPGRIPGSMNIPWSEAVDGMEKIFKSREELAKLFESRGITKDKEIVCYCQVGERASHTFLALRMAGYPNVKIYDRSFSEWSNNFELPVEVSS